MIKNKELVIIGAGETAMLAYEYFTHDSRYSVVSFAVEKKYFTNNVLNNLPIIELESIQEKYPPGDYEVFVAISSGKLNRARTKLYLELKGRGYVLASYISTRAFVWPNVKLGDNCFILEGNTLQPFVKIGNNVTMWSGNHIGHRTEIKDNCFISSHCVISGFCQIEENSFLGVNCTIENNVKIEKDNFIGAGVLIQKETKEKEVFQLKQIERSKASSHRLFGIKEK